MARHWRVYPLLVLAMVADGFDLQLGSFAAPSLARAWALSPAEIGWLLSASLIGFLVGSPMLGVLGDRRGRRLAVVISCILCGLATLLSAGVTSLSPLLLLRFVAGIGLGGVLPNVIALAAEHAPLRRRGMAIALVATGVMLGGALAGFTARLVIVDHGWQAFFAIGGLLPLVVALLLYVALPESPEFAEANAPGGEMPLISPRAPVGPSDLLTPALRRITLLLWLMVSQLLLSTYLLTGWLPMMMERAGLSPGEAAGANAIFQLSGVIGAVLVSICLARAGFALVGMLLILPCAGLAAVIGLVATPMALLVALAIAGFGLFGAQTALNALTALAYPLAIRAKGVGWALGVGRCGSIAGPLVGSVLVTAGMNGPHLLTAPIFSLLLAGAAAFYQSARERYPEKGMRHR